MQELFYFAIQSIAMPYAFNFKARHRGLSSFCNQILVFLFVEELGQIHERLYDAFLYKALDHADKTYYIYISFILVFCLVFINKFQGKHIFNPYTFVGGSFLVLMLIMVRQSPHDSYNGFLLQKVSKLLAMLFILLSTIHINKKSGTFDVSIADK